MALGTRNLLGLASPKIVWCLGHDFPNAGVMNLNGGDKPQISQNCMEMIIFGSIWGHRQATPHQPQHEARAMVHPALYPFSLFFFVFSVEFKVSIILLSSSVALSARNSGFMWIWLNLRMSKSLKSSDVLPSVIHSATARPTPPQLTIPVEFIPHARK